MAFKKLRKTEAREVYASALREAEAELAEIKARQDELSLRREVLEKSVSSLIGLLGSEGELICGRRTIRAAVNEAGRPLGAQIIELFQKLPEGEAKSVSEISEKLDLRSDAYTNKAVHNALNYLLHKQQLRRVARGRYALKCGAGLVELRGDQD